MKYLKILIIALATTFAFGTTSNAQVRVRVGHPVHRRVVVVHHRYYRPHRVVVVHHRYYRPHRVVVVRHRY